MANGLLDKVDKQSFLMAVVVGTYLIIASTFLYIYPGSIIAHISTVPIGWTITYVSYYEIRSRYREDR